MIGGRQFQRVGSASRAGRVLLGGLAVAVWGLWGVAAYAQDPEPDTAERDQVREPSPFGTEAPPAATPALPSFLDTTDERIQDDRPNPTPQQVQALREMEAEVERFVGAATAYQETVSSLLRREYLNQRRSKDQWYSTQVSEEEKLLGDARDSAIKLFERFIARYPDHPVYTPDAMFRLGELYFERSSVAFNNQSDNSGGVIRDTPDFTPTIELYQRIVEQFPDYQRIDGVYYLIGYCFDVMAESEQARLAWLNLVCANRYQYEPAAPADLDEPQREAPEDAHPALTLDAPGASRSAKPFVDPYQGCQPVLPNARFISEAWFRIGEHHFEDYSNPQALDLSISAYSKILEDPEDRNYNLALYKVAWAYYRAFRYPEAIDHFAKLVEWSDQERAKTGRAGSELRPEAITYLGISFAYDDWNENLVPDETEGLPRGIDRIQDPNLLDQDRSWTPEVYVQLGQVYFDEAKYAKAIEVWNLTLERWPLHERAPEITNLIASSYMRMNDMDKAVEWRARLGNYGEGSEWEQANLDHPAELRKARDLAENALIGTAIHYHQEAQRLRRNCVAQQQLDLCRQAQEFYDLAASSYRSYLVQHPNNPQAYELQYNLADALFWSEDYEGAAQQYAAVRDSNLDDKHLAEAARRVVESVKRIADAAEERGELEVPEEPPEPEGAPAKVSPKAMPPLVQRLARARELYIARVDEDADKENVREAYEYNNALLLYLYGYWDYARERFSKIFDKRCVGPHADETGKVAWLNLRNIAVKLGNIDEVERLGRELSSRECTFSSDPSVAAVDCSRPENKNEPQCRAQIDMTNIRYARAVDVFDRAQKAEGDEQRRLYEQAAAMLVTAVNEDPDHDEAPLALEKAAIALQRTSRFESAARLYQRIVDEVAPRRAESPEQQRGLDLILGNAYFQLGFNASRFFDFDRAVSNYRMLADSPRFAQSDQQDIQDKRQDALINAAVLLERLQRYGQAADYYERAASTTKDPDLRRRASYNVAEMAYRRKNWNQAVSQMTDFIRRFGRDADAGPLVVQAQWRIAQARKAQNNERAHTGALRDVVDAFQRSGEEPGSLSAEYAAEARFRLIDEEADAFESFGIQPGRPATLKRYVETLVSQIESGSRRAKEVADKYDAVPPYRRPKWTVAALVRQGRVYEILARAVLNAPFVMPSDLQRQLRQVGPDQREEVRFQVEDQVRQTLDQRVRPIECFAVARYALAARAARAGTIGTEYAQTAVDRLQAYGEERIAECIAEAQRSDPQFPAYEPGEFRRAARGQHLLVDPGQTPPLLLKESGP